MKKRKSTQWGFLLSGILLQGVLLACAGHETMPDTMNAKKMQNTTMQDTGTSDAKMTDSKMPDDGMKASRMHDVDMQGTKMQTNGMMNGKTATAMTAMLSGSEGHRASGKVHFSDEMGHRKLVLSDIKIEKVPDGHVYLAKDGDRTTGIDLGVLKQFSGTVSFALPTGTKPEQYDSVIIYCKRYHVEIGRAMLGEKM
jgi:Electron transfer DM13